MSTSNVATVFGSILTSVESQLASMKEGERLSVSSIAEQAIDDANLDLSTVVVTAFVNMHATFRGNFKKQTGRYGGLVKIAADRADTLDMTTTVLAASIEALDSHLKTATAGGKHETMTALATALSLKVGITDEEALSIVRLFVAASPSYRSVRGRAGGVYAV